MVSVVNVVFEGFFSCGFGDLLDGEEGSMAD